MKELALSTIVTQPPGIRRFPHRVDGVGRLVEAVETTEAALSAATFLDGRERFWTRQHVVPLDSLAQTVIRTPPAFLFNVGFCGSTLLAQLLGAAGPALVLREPQVLTDIAAQAAAIAAAHGSAAPGEQLALAVRALLTALPQDRALAIKPSNGGNGLIPQYISHGLVGRALFMTMERRDYLGAAFHGGRDRLALCARLAPLVAAALPGGTARLQRAIDGEDDPLRRIARIVALLHAQQEALFADAARALGPDRCGWIALAEIERDPAMVLGTAAQVLGLTLYPDWPERARPLLGQHSKDASTSFSLVRHRAELQANEQLHGTRFDAALDWLARDWPEAGGIPPSAAVTAC